MNKLTLRIGHLAILMLLLWGSSLAGQSIQFYGEKVDILLQGDFARITGEYYFKNNTPLALTRSLYYPFVLGHDLPWPDSIAVYNVSDRKMITFREAEKGILFMITIPADSMVIYTVTYRQRTLHHRMEYFLTTTEHWDRPLSFVEYTIMIPKSYELTYLSIPPSEVDTDSNYQLYKIHRNNYIPETELIVEWTGSVR